jgi:hypothetical protein
MPPSRDPADDGAMTDKVLPEALVAGPGFSASRSTWAWLGSWLATAGWPGAREMSR